MSKLIDLLHDMREGKIQPIEPRLDQDQIPWCDEGCPYHDGKRCELLGHQPDPVCVPAVRILVEIANHRLIIEHAKGGSDEPS